MLIAVAGLASCGSDPKMDWKNYSPDVKQRIEGYTASKDCAGLQREFDTADANNDAQRSRTGSNNADLMGYLDDLMRDAGCYK